jgi:hypothetical protein
MISNWQSVMFARLHDAENTSIVAGLRAEHPFLPFDAMSQA